MTRMVIALFLLSLISCSTSDSDRSPASSDRPPQFVLLSFDGSKSLSMWDEILDFADEMEDEGRPVKYSFFVSGVYFVTPDKGNLYSPQGFSGRRKLSQGMSDIGWADTKNGINERVKFMNRAVKSGHEIGSHAVGHFNGSTWDQATWTNEFSEFNDLLFNWKRNNNTRGEDLVINESDIVGFRAPLLGVSSGLWSTLKRFNYLYDTSESKSRRWPVLGKFSGAWNIFLGWIPIVGTSSNTIAMDYNFKYRYDNITGMNKPLSYYENQVYESYMKYFYDSYYGNRAPVVIGHHFSKWHRGIYWNAYKRFAKAVCGQREVECITHEDFSRRMSKVPSSTYAKYKRGDFPRYRQRKSTDPEYLKIASRKIYDLKAKLSQHENGLTVNLDGEDKALDYDLKFMLGKKPLSGKELHEVADILKQGGYEKALLRTVIDHRGNTVNAEVRAIRLEDDGTVGIAAKSFEEYHEKNNHLAHDPEIDLDQMNKDYLENSFKN